MIHNDLSPKYWHITNIIDKYFQPEFIAMPMLGFYFKDFCLRVIFVIITADLLWPNGVIIPNIRQRWRNAKALK